jgi:hypothetical protein
MLVPYVNSRLKSGAEVKGSAGNGVKDMKASRSSVEPKWWQYEHSSCPVQGEYFIHFFFVYRLQLPCPRLDPIDGIEPYSDDPLPITSAHSLWTINIVLNSY